jgi:hypothetical protein
MQPGKAVCAIFALAMIASPAAAQDIDFGDDSGEYASDGECDDPRFTGPGTPTSLSVEHTLRDATDCRRLFGIGAIRLVRQKGEASVAECAAINFGDNSSRWANDGECDDPRFTGGRMADVLVPEDLGTDANDCQKLCLAGEIWLR